MKNVQKKCPFLTISERFVVIDQEIKVKPNEELNSSMLQSPDDQQSTYRKKKEQESKGFTIMQLKRQTLTTLYS